MGTESSNQHPEESKQPEEREQPEELDLLFTGNRWLAWMLHIVTSTQVALWGWFMFYEFGDGSSFFTMITIMLLFGSISQMIVSSVHWSPRIYEITRDPSFSNVIASLRLVSAVSGFLASFAIFYWQASSNKTGCFSEHLDKLDATYFAVTTFTTTGFGDITPILPLCRGLVTLQMASGVLVLSVVIGLAVGRAVARNEERSLL